MRDRFDLLQLLVYWHSQTMLRWPLEVVPVAVHIFVDI